MYSANNCSEVSSNVLPKDATKEPLEYSDEAESSNALVTLLDIRPGTLLKDNASNWSNQMLHTPDLSQMSYDTADYKSTFLQPLSYLLLAIILFTAISGLLMGYDLCVVAVVLEPISKEFELCPVQNTNTFKNQIITQRHLLQNTCTFVTHNRFLLTDEFKSCVPKEMFVALVSPGAAIGSFVAGFIADFFGRKLTLGLSDFFIILGTFTMGLSQHFAVLLTGRFFLGLGIGIGFVIFSTYVSEISPDHRRGQLVSCQEVAQCLGCLISYALIGVKGSNNIEWRWMLLGAGILAAVQLLGLFFLPESPRWLMQRQREIQAENALRRIGGLSKPEPLETITSSDFNRCDKTLGNVTKFDRQKSLKIERKKEIHAAKEQYVVQTLERMRIDCVSDLWSKNLPTLSFDTTGSSTAPTTTSQFKVKVIWNQATDVFRKHKWQMFVALACATCQNLTGSTAILYYSNELFKLGGVNDPLWPGIGIGIAKIFGIIMVIVCVERFGRKRFLLIGSIGTFICLLACAIAFSKTLKYNNTTIIVSSIILFMFFQNISWAGLMFVVASEVLPSSFRGRGMGLTIAWFWILAFITQSTLETLMQHLTIPGVFFFYASTNFLAILFTWFFIPDLSGISLEEITNTYR